MKKILIPTDFSKNAMNAIEYTLNSFEHEFCKFYFLHAYQQDVYDSKKLITEKNINQITIKASENSRRG